MGPSACNQIGIRAGGTNFTGTRWIVVLHFLSSRKIGRTVPSEFICIHQCTLVKLSRRRHGGPLIHQISVPAIQVFWRLLDRLPGLSVRSGQRSPPQCHRLKLRDPFPIRATMPTLC
jgi:hypothetical protein